MEGAGSDGGVKAEAGELDSGSSPVLDQAVKALASPNFPAGLRVLVVDDDPLCLKITEQMLRRCEYEVACCDTAASALQSLRDKAHNFDLVLSDVYMPDMDGFKLLEAIGLELDLPVIMMSSNGEHTTVMRGVTHGACDFLIKPVRIEELRNIWQHVIRRSKHASNAHAREGEGEADMETDGAAGRKRKESSRDGSCNPEGQGDDGGASKKPRVVWSVEMHQQFVSAVNKLGVDKAVPKKILELMQVDGLTRENVASHLQKYRLYLKRLQQNAAAPGAGRPGLKNSTSIMQVVQEQQQQQQQDTAQPDAQAAATTTAAAAAAAAAGQPAGVAASLPALGAPDAAGMGLMGLMPGAPALQGMGMGSMAAMNPLMASMGLGQMGLPLPGLPGMAGLPGAMGLAGGLPGMPMGMPGMPAAAAAMQAAAMGIGQMPGLRPGMPADMSGVMLALITQQQQQAAAAAAAATAAAAPTSSGGGSSGGPAGVQSAPMAAGAGLPGCSSASTLPVQQALPDPGATAFLGGLVPRAGLTSPAGAGGLPGLQQQQQQQHAGVVRPGSTALRNGAQAQAQQAQRPQQQHQQPQRSPGGAAAAEAPDFSAILFDEIFEAAGGRAAIAAAAGAASGGGPAAGGLASAALGAQQQQHQQQPQPAASAGTGQGMDELLDYFLAG